MSEDPILLVEDNPEHAVLVQALLDYRSLASEVFVAQTVAEAKSYLKGEWPFDDPVKSPRPRLIVLDHWLEDGTGLDLLDWLQGQPGLKGIGVIVFTSCGDPEVESQALAMGASGFFHKPEGFEELGDAIESIIRPGNRRQEEDRDDGLGPAMAG
jgi:DNA-binding response OmpR family regulator